jgi:hypothetical protein
MHGGEKVGCIASMYVYGYDKNTFDGWWIRQQHSLCAPIYTNLLRALLCKYGPIYLVHNYTIYILPFLILLYFKLFIFAAL